MSIEATRKGEGSVVFFIATKDIINEILISACLVLSVIAVLTPILLLASVKVGFIDKLRSDLIQDPSFREIRPAAADLRPVSLFDDIRKWPHVEYVMPSVMFVPREVDMIVKGDGAPYRAHVKLLPSDNHDPLYVRLAGTPPSGDKVVLTSQIAKDAKLAIGDKFALSINRIENDKRKRVTLDVVLAGILPSEMLSLPTILASPEIDRAIESYRSGIAVPDRGWLGVLKAPKQSFGYMLVRTTDPLGETARTKIGIRIGATDQQDLPASELASKLELIDGGISLSNPSSGFLLYSKSGEPYSLRDEREANAVLHNDNATALGVNTPRAARLFGTKLKVVGFDPAMMTGTIEGLDKVASLGTTVSLNNHIILPESLREAYEKANRPDEVAVEFSFETGQSTISLTLPLRVAGLAPINAVLASGELVAMLKWGERVPLAYDPSDGSLVEQSAGYRGFRAVGKTIDDIPALVEKFNQAQIPVRARSDEILKLQRLERSLNILVAVVAGVALVGGYSILSANFFANVRRKQIDYAMMRLIGMQKSRIFRIPMVQGILIAACGYLMSLLCYFTISALLNGYVASELNFGGRLSVLHLPHFLFVGIFVIVGSAVASIAASREATRIDPAQALRGG